MSVSSNCVCSQDMTTKQPSSSMQLTGAVSPSEHGHVVGVATCIVYHQLALNLDLYTHVSEDLGAISRGMCISQNAYRALRIHTYSLNELCLSPARPLCMNPFELHSILWKQDE
jgi:hypothetical protein